MQALHRTISRASRSALAAAGLAATACADSALRPADDAPQVFVETPAPEVVVGATGSAGWVAIRGRVTGLSNLERLTYRVGAAIERGVEVRSHERDEGAFDLAVGELPLGDHVVTLTAYARRGTSREASAVKVYVVPAVREIPVPAAAAHAFPAAINSHGEVTGYWLDLEEPTWHAFLFRGGQTQRLSSPTEWRSAAPGLNDRGDVVGYVVGTPAVPVERATLWRAGTAHPLLAQPGAAVAINDDGAATGWTYVDDGPPRAFVARGGTVTVFGDPGRASGGHDINARGDVAGTSHGPGGDSFGFVYNGGSTRQLGSLGGLQTTAEAINDAGTVAGYSEVADRTSFRAYTWRDGQMHQLPSTHAGIVASYACDINNRDVVVGELVETLGGQAFHRGFVYTGESMLALDDLLGDTGYDIIGAYAVSDRGEIAAVAVRTGVPGWLRPVIVALPGGPEAARGGAFAARGAHAVRLPQDMSIATSVDAYRVLRTSRGARSAAQAARRREQEPSGSSKRP
jgi:probable HAF family extracellular repeat protein